MKPVVPDYKMYQYRDIKRGRRKQTTEKDFNTEKNHNDGKKKNDEETVL